MPTPARVSPGSVLAVALGGALGTVARYELGLAWPVAPGTFPTTTLAINLAGSLVLGVLLTLLAAQTASAHRVRAFGAVGFCGGFTTFSTWMVESVLLARDGDAALGLVYTVVSLIAGLVAVALGVVLARAFVHRDPAFDPRVED
ncbi:MAG: fluoride efflux transporter CrcB [Acidimicrobiia bacterium]